MPTELLDSILIQTWAEKRPSGPINRALLPWYDRYSWKTVSIASPADHAKIRDIVARRPHVRALCETLRINLGPDLLSPTWLETVLPGFPNLVTLELNDLSAAAFNRLVSEQQPHLLPTRLRELTVYCTTGTLKDPYHPSHWKPVLDRLPELIELGLDLRSIETPTGRIKTKSTYAFPQLESLYVALPQKGRSSALTLIESAPNLKALELASNSPIPDFAGALAALKEPGKLTRLELDADPKMGWAFPSELSKLVKLETLILDGQWQRLSQDDVDALGRLSFSRFSLGPATDYPLKFLLASLRNGRQPNLKHLQFDNIKAKEGYDWESDAWEWELQIEEIRDARRSWRRAKYTKAFDGATLRELKRICDQRKIETSASIQTALDVDAEISAMKRELDTLRHQIRMRGTGFNRGINGGYDDWY